MLAANGLLESLSMEEKAENENYKDSNNDYDFSEVLKFFGTKITPAHTLRFADGQEKEFSFNN